MDEFDIDVGDFQPFRFNTLACKGNGGGSDGSSVDGAVSHRLTHNLFPKADGWINRAMSDRARQQFGYQNLRARLQDESDITTGARDLALTEGLDRLGGFSTNMEQSFNSFLDPEAGRAQTDALIDRIGRGAGEQFNRYILPGINDQANAAGQFGGGSRRGIAEGVAAGDMSNNLLDQISEVELGQLNMNRQLQMEAMGMAPTVQSAIMSPYNLQGQIGRELDARAQLEHEDDIAGSNWRRDSDLQTLQQYAGLLGYSGPQQFSPTQASNEPSKMQNAMGGALAGASIGAMEGSTIGGPWGAAIGGAAGLLLS